MRSLFKPLQKCFAFYRVLMRLVRRVRRCVPSQSFPFVIEVSFVFDVFGIFGAFLTVKPYVFWNLWSSIDF